jgi:hypothetical protein
MYNRNVAMNDAANGNEEHSNHHSFYVDSGDLRIWEYLTDTFDHEIKFEQLQALQTRQPECANAMHKTADHPKWRALHNPQHQVSTLSCLQPQSPSMQNQTTEHKRPANAVEPHDTIDYFNNPIFYENLKESQWIDQYASGIPCLPRPTIEPFSTRENAQKTKALSVAKSPPFLRPFILERNSPSWLSSIEIMAEPPSPSVLSDLSYLRSIELAETHPPAAQRFDRTKASTTPTMPDFPQRNGRVLSHLKFPSFSHILPPHQEQMNRKLLLKPLSPYNFYYRDERDNIIQNMQHPEDPLPPPISDQNQEKLESLLFQRWFVDPTKTKRRHRRSHGCISFEELARQIAERWHQQPESIYNFYYTVSTMDKMYHRNQLKLIQDSKMGATSQQREC